MHKDERKALISRYRLKFKGPLIFQKGTRIEDLEENECRFHIDNHGFCGKKKKQGSSYCPKHASIVAPKEAQRKPMKVYTRAMTSTNFKYEE